MNDTDSDKEERDRLEELITMHKRRLYPLQKREALEGPRLPPETKIEIEDLEQDIAELERRVMVLRSNVLPLENAEPAILDQAQPVFDNESLDEQASVAKLYDDALGAYLDETGDLEKTLFNTNNAILLFERVLAIDAGYKSVIRNYFLGCTRFRSIAMEPR